ncbi:helix-turn-helix domain-containing protein [Phenylobacterium sp.]|uniref:helix-turn-helix domain-containing protein n=1 Tax=Phenylobacterium sp. TaxID=1871053 RepID=UPI00352218D9
MEAILAPLASSAEQDRHNHRSSQPDDAPVDPAALRAARALLNWSMRDLAQEAGLALATLHRLETSAGRISAETYRKIRTTFAAHCVQITSSDENSGATLSHGR